MSSNNTFPGSRNCGSEVSDRRRRFRKENSKEPACAQLQTLPAPVAQAVSLLFSRLEKKSAEVLKFVLKSLREKSRLLSKRVKENKYFLTLSELADISRPFGELAHCMDLLGAIEWEQIDPLVAKDSPCYLKS